MSADHNSHHVIPFRVYIAVGAMLLMMTAVTVAVSFVHLGAFNLLVAMGIATFKAMLVGLVFMHLYYDNKLFATVFLAAMTFLAIFIVLTMFDTMRRGDIYDYERRPIKSEAAFYQNLPADTTHGQPEGMH